jgi:RNA polymerase sigma-70 factor (ECF subfamily)
VSAENEKKTSLLAPLADAYEPSQADADRIFARIQASLSAPATPEPAPRSTPADAPAPPPASPGKPLVLAGLACVALLVLGGVVVQQTRSHEPSATIAHSVSAPPPDAPVVAPQAPQGVHEVATATTPMIPSVSVDSLPSANAPAANAPAANAPAANAPAANAKEPPLGAAARPASPDAPPSTETLEKEARLLAEARRAVQRGDGAQALSLLEEHARVYPNGWLANDRAAERIVVLCSLGRRDEAVREAKVFLAGRPVGPLTRRVTMSCAGEP